MGGKKEQDVLVRLYSNRLVFLVVISQKTFFFFLTSQAIENDFEFLMNFLKFY